MRKGFAILIMFLALIIVLLNINTESEIKKKEEVLPKPRFEYGIMVDSFLVSKNTVKSGQTLGEILYANHIDYPDINKIVEKSKNIFDVKRVNAGKKYTIMCSKDSLKRAKYFVYEEDAINYVVFNLQSKMSVYRGKKELVIKLKKAQSKIKGSLWLTLEEQNLSPRLTHELSTIYAWTIDFFKIQEGDGFNVYYEDKYIYDADTDSLNYVGIGRILAAEFLHKNNTFYAFYFKEKGSPGDYYDDKGKTLRKAFLMAPVDYKRISSRYSKKRKHPVTGQWKGHFGTDYAAAIGTPIWSTANGTVTEARFKRNNGNYVKIRHNNTYSTQYLHMSKIHPKIKPGVYVRQGEIIGYVGMTGLATGPHVCYRFWKNGKQVDPYKQKLPPGEPIKKENKEEYIFAKDSLMNILLK